MTYRGAVLEQLVIRDAGLDDAPRNLQYMTTFARRWNVEAITPQPVAQLP